MANFAKLVTHSDFQFRSDASYYWQPLGWLSRPRFSLGPPFSRIPPRSPRKNRIRVYKKQMIFSVRAALKKRGKRYRRNSPEIQAASKRTTSLASFSPAKKILSSALDAFQQALKLDQHSVRTMVNVGNLYVAQQKLDLAEQQFLASRAQQNPDAHFNLGLVLLAQNRPAGCNPAV